MRKQCYRMDKYTQGRVIGRGTSGDAVLAHRNVDGLLCVIKRLPLGGIGGKEAEAFENEVRLLSQLHHPCVVDAVDSFVNDDGANSTFLCIVMRYCDGGDLGSLLQANRKENTTIPQDQIFFHFVQLALALEYIHSENILHRDLKSMNVFIHKGMMKIGDFGVAKALDPESPFAQTCIGTPYYMSPEVFMGKPYNHKSDVWALGCLLYELTTLKQPFHTDSLNDLASKIMKGSYAPISPQYSNSHRSLIKQMLALSADDRPAVRHILKMDMLQGVLRSVLTAMLSGKEDYSEEVLEVLRAQFKRLGLDSMLELVNGKLLSKQKSFGNEELEKKCEEQELQLQREEAAERELENLVTKLRFGYDERSVQIDHRSAMARERKQSFNHGEKRREALLGDDAERAERRKTIRMKKEMLSDKRQRREEELKKFERIQEKNTQIRKQRLKKEKYFEKKERQLTEKMNGGEGGDSAQAFNLECQRISTTIGRESEELEHLQDERKWLERRLGQMDLQLSQFQLPQSQLVDVKTSKKPSPLNARRTTRLPSAFGGPRLAYREGRKTMALPSTTTSKRDDEERKKSKTTANLPQSPSRNSRFEDSSSHLSPSRRRSSEEKAKYKNGKNAKSRVLAAKARKRKEQERKEKEALSAARKEYDLERQKADKRTRDFMHNSGFIPDEISLPDFASSSVGSANNSPMAADGGSFSSPTRNSLEDSDDSFEELQVLEEEHYQDEWELNQLQAAVERHHANLQKLRHSLLMNKRALEQGAERTRRNSKEKIKNKNNKIKMDDQSPLKVLPVIIKSKDGKGRRKHRSTDQKIRDLTKQCTSLLGKEVFLKAKVFLQDANIDPERNGQKLLDSLVEIMGKDNIVHWTLLDNLIYLESKRAKKVGR